MEEIQSVLQPEASPVNESWQYGLPDTYRAYLGDSVTISACKLIFTASLAGQTTVPLSFLTFRIQLSSHHFMSISNSCWIKDSNFPGLIVRVGGGVQMVLPGGKVNNPTRTWMLSFPLPFHKASSQKNGASLAPSRLNLFLEQLYLHCWCDLLF